MITSLFNQDADTFVASISIIVLVILFLFLSSIFLTAIFKDKFAEASFMKLINKIMAIFIVIVLIILIIIRYRLLSN